MRPIRDAMVMLTVFDDFMRVVNISWHSNIVEAQRAAACWQGFNYALELPC